MDKYQERYEEHIQNKLKREQKKHHYDKYTVISAIDVLTDRKSVRRFNGNHLTEQIYDLIDLAIEYAPSSCNRKGVYYDEVTPEYAERVLVGGKGWCDKADKVFFLYGDRLCYKNPKEVSYMPYLDGGFAGQNVYLFLSLYDIGCCFINPNIKEPLENEDYFLGAFAVGDYD